MKWRAFGCTPQWVRLSEWLGRSGMLNNLKLISCWIPQCSNYASLKLLLWFSREWNAQFGKFMVFGLRVFDSE